MKKLVITLSVLISFTIFGLCKGQASTKYIEIEWKNGSEAAKKIMKSDFYYDALDAMSDPYRARFAPKWVKEAYNLTWK